MVGLRILVENEAADAEPGGLADSGVAVFFDGVADVDESSDRLPGMLAGDMVEHAADLRWPDRHASPVIMVVRRRALDTNGPATSRSVAAKVDELDVEPADPCHGVEHAGDVVAGHIPGRLSRSRCVEREDQPGAGDAAVESFGATLAAACWNRSAIEPEISELVMIGSPSGCGRQASQAI